MEDNDDDFFSDDGFDDLPPGTLFQLEQNALQATQAQNLAPSQPTSELNIPARIAQDQFLPRAHAFQARPSVSAHATLQPPARLHTGLTNDYGDLDVGELDAEVLDDENNTTIAFDQPVVFGAQPNRPQNVRGPAYDSRDFDDTLPDLMEIETDQQHRTALQESTNVVAERLERENERYKQIMEELATAKSMAETKTGEISIIRSNQLKLTENYERQLAALRKTIAEEATRHKEEVEAARAEGKMLATENAFLKQDLAEESLRINNLKAKGRANEKVPPVTPKKTKVLPFRDGFDDEEILAVSPSKSTRSKRLTPTVPGKRKRRESQDSPIPLQLSPRVDPMAVDPDPGTVSDDAMGDTLQVPPAAQDKEQDSQSMKRILNHRTDPHEEPDIEVMSGLKFPSEPQRTLATILLQEMGTLRIGNDVVEYARAVMSMWSRALKEKFYQPVPMFMAIMQYIFTVEAPSIGSQLVEHLVPLLQDSGDINGIPRFKHSPVWRQNFGQVRQTPQSELEPLVDTTNALGLLYQVACQSLHIDQELEKFWRAMRYDFVLMMLNCSQLVADITLMLNLLTTSVRAESFGSIQEDEQDQIANENYIVDRVANLLSERLLVDEGRPPYTPFETCEMRLEALSLLTCIAFNVAAPQSTHGSSVLASHPTALARLIRAMHDELDALYSSTPEAEQHAALVNGLMALVYGVMKRHPEAELQSKLERVAGGKQKFIVVMTRLAFSEGLMLEASIDDETVEMAHEILDDAVNPQEAEALQEVFSSARRE